MLQLRNKTQGKGPLWLVEAKYSMGSDPGCDIQVKSEGVKGRHAELHVDGDNIALHDLVGSTLLKLNGQPTVKITTLKSGDVLSLGNQEFEVIDPKTVKKVSAQPRAGTPEWSLKALNTALADKHYKLIGSQTLGRSQDCDVSLGVVHLSRKHARITVTDNGLKIEDLNSSNGTYINGKKITQAMAYAGDELSFDTLKFRVIGPVTNNNKSMMGSQGDGDMTTVRPALKIPETSGSSSRTQPKTTRKAATKPQTRSASSRPAQSQPSHSSQGASQGNASSGGSNGLLWLVIIMLIGAGAAAWFFLK